MGKKKKNARCITKKEYLKLFSDDKSYEKETIHSHALKEALDIRKFEIDLYWKRTAFFWAFISVIYTALFNVLCKYIDYPAKYSFFVPVISALSSLGFFFSVAWHMVNKGSKFWQENWETHVSLLEKSKIGPLHDVYLNPKTTGNRWIPTKEFDFSVSKVNMWASTIMILCSLACSVGCTYFLWNKTENKFSIILPCVIIIFWVILLMKYSDGNKNLNISDSEQTELNMIQILQ